MKSKNKKLNLEPTIFRDWSVAYSELVHISAVKEFKKQYRWGYSDLIFMWDGKKETLYRGIEEHIHGMFSFIKRSTEKDKNFIKKVSSTLVKDVNKYHKKLDEWLDLDFRKLNNKQILAVFSELKSNYIPILPRFLIVMYFPQQLEKYYSEYQEQFKKENKICIETRSLVDKILAPLTDKLLKKIGNYALEKAGVENFNEYGRFLSINEIENLLNNSYSPKEISKLENTLLKRSKYFLFADGAIRTTSIKSYVKSKNWSLMEPKINPKLEIIKGMPTYIVAESVRGKAKIVENKKELNKIKKGDIIIAPMTTPEYAAIFGKVLAIVTDEGGITCHAAIISRELNVPCVVGTKIATKVFRDNDYIEVNTKEGEVKLLKRKKYDN